MIFSDRADNQTSIDPNMCKHTIPVLSYQPSNDGVHDKNIAMHIHPGLGGLGAKTTTEINGPRELASKRTIAPLANLSG